MFAQILQVGGPALQSLCIIQNSEAIETVSQRDFFYPSIE